MARDDGSRQRLAELAASRAVGFDDTEIHSASLDQSRFFEAMAHTAIPAF